MTKVVRSNNINTYLSKDNIIELPENDVPTYQPPYCLKQESVLTFGTGTPFMLIARFDLDTVIGPPLPFQLNCQLDVILHDIPFAYLDVVASSSESVYGTGTNINNIYTSADFPTYNYSPDEYNVCHTECSTGDLRQHLKFIIPYFLLNRYMKANKRYFQLCLFVSSPITNPLTAINVETLFNSYWDSAPNFLYGHVFYNNTTDKYWTEDLSTLSVTGTGSTSNYLVDNNVNPIATNFGRLVVQLHDSTVHVADKHTLEYMAVNNDGSINVSGGGSGSSVVQITDIDGHLLRITPQGSAFVVPTER